MNRSQAEKIVGNSYHSVNTLNAASQIQAAESLNEIAQFTVRDRFAVAAMQSLLTQYGAVNLTVSKLQYAYEIADMMLKARGK